MNKDRIWCVIPVYNNAETVRNIVEQCSNYINNILVIDESEDPLHDTEKTKKIASLMPNSRLIDIKTNRAAHSSPMIKIIRETIKS